MSWLRPSLMLLTLAACSAEVSTTDAGSGPTSGDAGVDAPEDAGAVADPCPALEPACPVAPGDLVRGGGMRAVDRCAFPLAPEDTAAASYDAWIDALPAELARVTLAEVATDLNRTATRIPAAQLPGTTPGVRRAYRWQSGDMSVAYWIPQGITGSFDGLPSGTVGGRKLVLVSWYYSQADDPGSTVDKGVRIAIVDVTDPDNVTYRFALLVEPFQEAQRVNFRAVHAHAGGLAWVGDRLYVPITSRGFRVFDLSRILRLDGLEDRIGYDAASGTYHAHGYRYVIPQIETYTSTGACSPRFSFVALDQSSTPPSLISGEYDAASPAGRLYRWPLDASGALQRTDRDRVIPDGAWLSAETHVQGALAHDETFWLSSSRPAGGAGALYRTRVNTPSTTLGWSDTPEDVAFDPQAQSVWSLSEGLDARYVFEVSLDAID